MSDGHQTPATKEVKLGECTYILLLKRVLKDIVYGLFQPLFPHRMVSDLKLAVPYWRGRKKEKIREDLKLSCFVISQDCLVGVVPLSSVLLDAGV